MAVDLAPSTRTARRCAQDGSAPTTARIANVDAACAPAFTAAIRSCTARTRATGSATDSGSFTNTMPNRLPSVAGTGSPRGRRSTGTKTRRSCGTSPCAARCRRRAPAVTASSTSFTVASRAAATRLTTPRSSGWDQAATLSVPSRPASRVRGSRVASSRPTPVLSTRQPNTTASSACRSDRGASGSTPATGTRSWEPAVSRVRMPGRRGSPPARSATAGSDDRRRRRSATAARWPARCRRRCSGAAGPPAPRRPARRRWPAPTRRGTARASGACPTGC